MMQKTYGLWFAGQRAEIDAHCFGDCGQGIFGASVNDPELGPLTLCEQDKCPHLSLQMGVPLGKAPDGREIYLRRLMSLTPNATLCGERSESERAPGCASLRGKP
jgi:hypothetical protein